MRWANGASIYSATDRFRDRALRADDSLFTSGVAIWAAPIISDLHRRYNLQPDTSSASFEVKLRRQLDGAPDSTIQLAAEAIYIHQLIVDDISGKAKRKLLSAVLSWMQQPTSVPSDLDAALDHGLIGGGLAFKTLRPFQLHFLVEFAKLWKTLSPAERDAALGDPWTFKQLLWQVPIQSGYAQREALLHLLFPDSFEDIVSREQKARIAAAFAAEVGEPVDDVDRRLAQVRHGLNSKFGEGFSFYDPEIRPLWEATAEDPKLWDEFFKWAKKIRELPNFAGDEREYKLSLVSDLKPAVEHLRRGEGWLEALTAGLHSKFNNITRWQANQPLLAWCKEHPEEAEAALKELWDGDSNLASKLKGFLNRFPEDLLSGSDLLRLLSLLLLAANPTEWPPVTAGSLAKASKLTGYAPPGPGSDEGQRYRHALSFFDRIISEGRKRGLTLPDRLEAQGTMWATVESPPPDSWSPADRQQFLAWRSESPPSVVEARTESPSAPDAPPTLTTSLQQLADELFMPVDFLSDVVTLLRSKKQVVLYGPPGTGKTYLAQRLAEYLAPASEARDLVQFHPSYAYEDFVEGYRPVDDGGRLTYVLKPGPLVRLTAHATQTGGEHVLIIDEINRGNLPRILGELLFALEYRDQPVTLLYRDVKFILPPNVLVIGTMNTADRSIGLIDAALRRRFHFIRLFPGEGPLAGLLRSWLDKNNPDMIGTAAIVDRLNARIRSALGPHLQVGHSYFLREDLSQETLAQIWDNDIMPFLEDQFYGKEEELQAFALDRLREADVADHPTAGTTTEASSAQPG